MNSTSYKHWSLEKDDDGIFWLWFDKANSSANTLDQEVFNELEKILDVVENDKPTAVIIGSAKASGFIAGANIEKFTQVKTVEQAKEFVRRGQILFDRLAGLPMPTIAMIDGFCVGGGLELALACRYRVAHDDDKTRLGLPEVMLGIHPGWGGSVRLPALIGAPKALQLILTGKTFRAKAAMKMGFVDTVVPLRQLKRAARYYALNKPKPHKASALERLTNVNFIRPLIAKKAQATLAEKGVKKEHYPAPYAVLHNWLVHGAGNNKAMLGEAESLAKLVLDDTAKNLVRVFFLQERMKGLAKDFKSDIKHVHVIGAGVMGGDIAAWCALKGLTVTLQDREAKYIAPAIARAHKLYKKRLRKPRAIQAVMDRLIPDLNGDGIAKADVIIEAIVENLEAKQDLLKNIEAKASKNAIIASNTSSIPLDEMNTVMKHPERLVGIHFFNPVARMQLVEVVHGKVTSDNVVKSAIAFVKRISRLPLPVTSSPGFLVNRVLMPYLMECVDLIDEGVPASAIDQAATTFGMPIGPVELADTVGLDICLSVAKNLTQHYGGQVPQRLVEMVEAGKLGRKSGQGFYTYKKGKAQKVSPKDYPQAPDVAERLILRMLNESMACLREDVVKDGDLLDAGMIFGAGFAPFRGGPIQYICTEGMDTLKNKLLQFEKAYGSRFKPDAFWEKKTDHESERTTA